MPKPYDHAELSEALDQGYNLSIERLAATVCDLMTAEYTRMGGNEIQPTPEGSPDGVYAPPAPPTGEPRQKRPYNRKPKDTEFDL